MRTCSLSLMIILLFLVCKNTLGKETNSNRVFVSDTLLWSSPATWEGILPQEGDTVSIPSGSIVRMDISPPVLSGIIIDGTLIFEDTDLDVNLRWIMVHGTLEIGTPLSPISSNISITFTASDTEENIPAHMHAHGMGTKALVVMNGTLRVYGTPPSTIYTKLTEHATQGTSLLNVIQSDGWQVDDQILIAPTDYYLAGNGISETQRVGISNVVGTTVEINQPTNAFHWGRMQFVTETGLSLDSTNVISPPLPNTDSTSTPVSLDQRALVANLTRNIVFQSANDALWQDHDFGMHIMIMGTSSLVEIDGLEIRRGGQQGRLRRYPVHWHMLSYNGSTTLPDATGHFIRNSVVNESMNRGIVIHGTNGLLVENNIVYDTRGHGIFTENASERRNIINNNVVLHVRNPAIGLKQHELGDFGSSGFWISNPDNIVTNNYAGDNQTMGFWLAFPIETFGESANVLDEFGNPMRPNRMRFGVFDGNTAFSNRREGVMLDFPEIDEAGNIDPEQYVSTTDGREIAFPWETVRRFFVRRIKSWKNGSNGFWDRAVVPSNLENISADNVGRFFAGSGFDGKIERTLAIGTSLNYALNGTGRPPEGDFAGGRSTPNPAAFATYHSTFDIRHNIMVNFPAEAGVRSGAFATEDYYVRPVDKGQIRNYNNRLINSHPGARLTAVWDYFTLAGALWDPHGTWFNGVEDTTRYLVYDRPFFTHGLATEYIDEITGSVGAPGPYYGFFKFVVNLANDRNLDPMALRVHRRDDNMAIVDTWEVAQGYPGQAFFHMRDFATHPSGIYELDFPTIETVTDVGMSVENLHSAADTVILAVEFSRSMEVQQAYFSNFFSYFAENHTVAPSFERKQVFTQVNSIQEVFDTPGVATWYHDLETERVWMKLRSHLIPRWNPAQVSESSDERLYNEVFLRIWGVPREQTQISGTEGWRILSNPHQNETFADFLQPIWTQGFPGADFAEGFPNVYTYHNGNETTNRGFHPLAHLQNSVSIGSGFLTYVFLNDNGHAPEDGEFPKTLYSYGETPPSSFDFPVTYAESDPSEDNGWFLAGNPSTDTVSWHNDFTLHNMNAYAYFWDNALETWTLAGLPGIGNAPDSIPPFTGFFVKAMGENPTMSFLSNNPVKITQEHQSANLIATLTLANEHKSSSFSIISNENASFERDMFDAFFLKSLSCNSLSIYGKSNGDSFSIISLPTDLTNEFIIPIFVENNDNLNAELYFEPADVPENWEIILLDELQQPVEKSRFNIGASSNSSSTHKANKTADEGSTHPLFSMNTEDVELEPSFFILIKSNTATNGTIETPDIPVDYALNATYPNPFNPTLSIEFQVPEIALIRMDILDLNGRIVSTISNQILPPGIHNLQWNASGFASGIYVVKFSTPNQQFIRKVTLIK